MNNQIPLTNPLAGGGKRLTLPETSPVVCDACGSAVFQEGNFIRRISKILTGQPDDSFTTVPTLVCLTCKRPLQMMLPDELKEKKVEIVGG